MYGTPTTTGPTRPAGPDPGPEPMTHTVRNATEGRRPWLPQDEYDRKHFDRRVRWCVEEGEHRQAELKRHRARHLRAYARRPR